jgi:hypothetical protein
MLRSKRITNLAEKTQTRIILQQAQVKTKATINNMLVLLALEVLTRGFCVYQGLQNSQGQWTERRTNEFKKHYGSSPVVLANQWHDMQTTELYVQMMDSRCS